MKKALKKMKENNIRPFMLNVSIKTDVSIPGWLGISDPDNYINIYHVEFELYLDNSYENKETIGEALCYYISGFDWANDTFINLLNTADAHSEDLLTAISPVVDKNGEVLESYMGCNVMYIHKFYLKHEYRHKGIGTILFPIIFDTLGRDVGVITIIPAPTENDGNTRIDSSDSRYESLYNKMCKFIMGYGFFCNEHDNRVWVKDTTLKD